MLSKKATCNSSHGQDSSYFSGWVEYDKNPYHNLHNPTGVIQMGLAENQLSLDILESWLVANPEATMFGMNDHSMLKEVALFQDYHGLHACKKEIADYMGEIRQKKVRFDPDKMVLTAGTTSANEIMMFCIAEPGEAILIPTPYYPGFDRDLKWRTGVEIVPINCSSKNGFRITKSALDKAYEEAQIKKLTVKGVLITNPSNPLGTTTNQQELNYLINFAISKNIHIVSDEIYGGTTFHYHPSTFTSILQVLQDRKLQHTDIWTRVHVVSGLSKDMGLPGFRIGMIYSNNDVLISAAVKMSSFGLISSQTQFFLSKLLGDKQFTKTYIMENQKRLKNRQNMLVSGLQKLGIRSLESNAGLFCWVDMRHLMKSNTFESEMELWKKIVYRIGINVTPGSSCHCIEPGWFRICFANLSEETLRLSIQRIKGLFELIIGEKKRQNHEQLSCSKSITFLPNFLNTLLSQNDSQCIRSYNI